MRIAYTLQQKAEAVALATVVGAEAAADQLGMDVRTVRGWAAKAGKAPELAVQTSTWEKLLDLALARVGAALSSGKVRPKDAAVIAGIAQRNMRDPEPTPEPPTEADEWVGQLMAALEARYTEHEVDCILDVLIRDDMRAFDQVDEETGLTDLTDIPSILAWVESIGDPEAWIEADRQARHDAMEAQLAANRNAAETARLATLDAETARLLAAAEAWLEVTDAA